MIGAITKEKRHLNGPNLSLTKIFKSYLLILGYHFLKGGYFSRIPVLGGKVRQSFMRSKFRLLALRFLASKEYPEKIFTVGRRIDLVQNEITERKKLLGQILERYPVAILNPKTGFGKFDQSSLRSVDISELVDVCRQILKDKNINLNNPHEYLNEERKDPKLSKGSFFSMCLMRVICLTIRL